MTSRYIKLAELDAPRCQLEYGVTCSATEGLTDPDKKCYNTTGSCQVPLEYSPGSEWETFRWVTNSEDLNIPELDIVAPSLVDFDISPQVIKPGENLGKRERVNASFKNHPYDNFAFDPYIEDRTFNAFKQGSYWGKFVAWFPNIEGYPFRIRNGMYNPDSADPFEFLETFHYVVDKIDRPVGGFQISALDPLTLTSDKKALAPEPSNGILSADFLTGAGSFTLEPPGIGAEYPLSGEGSIDKEYMTFTRVDDVFTVTGRGLFDSEEKDHDEGATFQLAAVFEGNYAEILEQLLGYTTTPSDWYDTANWVADAEENAPEILSARIASPTPVETLLNSFMKEVLLDIHSDVSEKKIKARKIKPEPGVRHYSEDNLKNLMPSLDSESRIDTVFFRFGRLNPVEKINEPKNYAGNLLYLDDDPAVAIQQNSAAIEQVYSIFIPSTLRQLVSDNAALLTARYNRVLKRATAVTVPELSSKVGDVVTLTCRYFQDTFGNPIEHIPMQVVGVNKSNFEHKLTLVEYSFGDFEFEGNRTISILVDSLNLNLRELHDATYGTGAIPPGTVITFQGNGEAVWGSSITTGFSVIVGDWPEVDEDGVTLVVNDVIIAGKGGNGGTSVSPVGQAGGPAFYTRVPIALNRCDVGGGGGGGGAAYVTVGSGYWVQGNGGAGHLPGSGYSNGTLYNGGTDGASPGGAGGDLGEPGEISSGGPIVPYAGGAAGVAIDGSSFVTLTDCNVFGAEIN